MRRRYSIKVDEEQSKINVEVFKQFRELELQYDAQDIDDCLKLKWLLEANKYPSDDQAAKHEQATRFGELDVHPQKLKQDVESLAELQFCQCCSAPVQQPMNFAENLGSELANGSVAIKMLEKDQRFIMKILAYAFLLYCSYAIISNFVCSRTSEHNCQYTNTCGINSIGLASKLVNSSTLNDWLFIIECWIGLLVMYVWVQLLDQFSEARKRVVQVRQIKASMFSLAFQKMPASITRQRLQGMLDLYALQQAQNMPKPRQTPEKSVKALYDGRFQISQFCIAEQSSEDDRSKIKEEQIQQYYQLFKAQLRHRKTSKSFRTGIKQLKEFKEELLILQAEYKDIIQSTRKQRQSELQSNQGTRTVYVTFHHNYAAYNLLKLNAPDSTGKDSTQTAFRIQGQKVKIRKAPEPEQILWENIGVSKQMIVLRKVFTYSAAFAILFGSLFVTYQLQRLNIAYNDPIISKAVSLTINLIDILLGVVIKYLNSYQKERTLSQTQVALALKATMFQLINCVALPVLVSVRVKDNVYRTEGLAEEIHNYALTNAFLAPLLKVFSLSYLWNRTKKYYYSRPQQKLDFKDQKEYNKVYERVTFEVGVEYSYILRTFIFTAFFMSLQPIIVFYAVLGIFLMFLAQRYTIFCLTTKPKVTSDFVSLQLHWVMHIPIVAYALGVLTWTLFLPKGHPKLAILPAVLTLALGLLSLLGSFKAIISKRADKKNELELGRGQYIKPKLYQSERLFMLTEYNRENPLTKAQGDKQFKEYVKAKYASFQLRANKLIAPQGEAGGVFVRQNFIERPEVSVQAMHNLGKQLDEPGNEGFITKYLKGFNFQTAPVILLHTNDDQGNVIHH